MSTSLTTKPLRQVGSVKELLGNDHARKQLAAVAARHISPERLMRVVAAAIRTTPKLQEAEPLSFLGALMQAAALGLEPNSPMQLCYLVPFANKRKGVTEVQLIVGYRGFKSLAWRSGAIDTMHADVVYSDDEEWSYGYGTDTHLRHKPGPQQGEKLAAYCHVKLKEGGQAFVVLPWTHVLRVRDASQNWQAAVKYGKTDASPWKTHEDVMAAKTAVRYLFQRGDVPMSIEMADAMEIDYDEGARVDYASFAMNPADGPIIEGDVENPDDTGPDVIEQDPESEPEPKPKAQKRADPKPKAEKKPDPEPDPEPLPLVEGIPKDRVEAYERLAERITNDLFDGDVDVVLATWDNEIMQMKADAPEIYKKIMDTAEEYRAARRDG